LGGARKRKNDEIASEQAKTDTAATDSMAEQEDKVTIPDEEAQRAMEKAQRKAERKAAKKLKKQHQASAGAADSSQLNDSSMYDDDNDGMDVDVDAQPFDYASAPSVLHPPRDPADRKGKGAAKSKPFNPYAKAMDAPKGLGRVQKERAGKSHTFKK
ncbi:exosome nuclease subunit, partial [Cryomyces antarcticus]